MGVVAATEAALSSEQSAALLQQLCAQQLQALQTQAQAQQAQGNVAAAAALNAQANAQLQTCQSQSQSGRRHLLALQEARQPRAGEMTVSQRLYASVGSCCFGRSD